MHYEYDPDFLERRTKELRELFKGTPESPVMPALTGWLCPKCGGGNAPWSASCPCTMRWEITC